MITPYEENARASIASESLESLDQPMGMCKSGDRTEITVVDDASIARSFGTRNRDFLHGLLPQIANAGAKGERPDELGVRCMLAFMAEGKPSDAIEATLLAQMAACHTAMMRSANCNAHAENLPDAESAERSFNRLARTFATLTETLLRYRASKQKISSNNGPVGDSSPGNLARPALTADWRRSATEVGGKRTAAGTLR